MGRGAVGDEVAIDGRRARRERTRESVIDAAFEILQEGRVPPPIDEVAARAGVSPSTIFRCFDGLDDMQQQAFLRFRERFGHLLDLTSPGDRTLDDRITEFVDARLRLYEAAGTIMTLGRLRAIEHAPLAAAHAEQHRALAAQVAEQFAPEIGVATLARGDELITLVDSLTSPDAWDVVRRRHGRTARQIRQMWVRALTTLLHDADEEAAT